MIRTIPKVARGNKGLEGDRSVFPAAPQPRTTRAGYFASLNAQQKSAVEHGAEQPLLIIAGAGSGKTNTLAHRVAHLIALGADTRRILLLTFSRRAAAEMQRRVERITADVLGRKGGEIARALPWSGTFHAIGARLLREYALEIGLNVAFTIHDREDSADLMNLVRHDLGFSNTEKRFPMKSTCLAIYSRTVNSQASLVEVIGKHFPWCAQWESELRRLFAAYVEAKQKQNVLDYDDLLLYWAQMLNERAIAEDIAARFDHILVDEYQDTNLLQASILLALKPTGQGLTVVGDDAQSIYSFRATTVRNILDFPNQFSLHAEVITLERNYRSTQPILAAANAVISLAEERFTKTLWSDRASAELPRLITVRDEMDQARCVAEKMLEYREAGIPLKHQAILFRASHHSAQLEIELMCRNIPFVKFGGLKFLEAAHIKDILGFLRWAENPRDRVSGFRVVQLLPGIGPATAAQLLDRIAETANALEAIGDFVAPAATAESWSAFVEINRVLRTRAAGWPAEIEHLCHWYEPHVERLYDDAVVRQSDLVQLAQIASTYSTRERFLTELTLDPPDATTDEAGMPVLDEDYLILSTIHSAKGQEWKAVSILNVIDGCIPSDLSTGSTAEIEEERRLLYVAMTRAKDHLHLLLPQRFFAHQQRGDGDRHMYTNRARFIPDSILDFFTSCSWPMATPHSRSSVALDREPVNIGAQLRRMWN
jgi:ATP-dependent DNA helicase UvrD/PcrA